MRNGLKALSNNPPHDKLALGFGGVVAAVGAIMLIWSAVQLTSQPWDLSPDTYAWGKPAENTPFTGDHYIIEVAGKKHTCYRGRQKYPHDTAPILYDPDDPSRCRAADAMDGLSEFELLLLSMGLGSVLIGGAFVMAYAAEPRQEWARNDPGPLLRPRLMWAARVLAVLGVVTPLTIGIMHGGLANPTGGPKPPSPDEFPRVEVLTAP